MVKGLFVRKNKKDFGNGLLNFAYNYPLPALIALPIVFDWPAKALRRSEDSQVWQSSSRLDSSRHGNGGRANRNHGNFSVWFSR